MNFLISLLQYVRSTGANPKVIQKLKEQEKLMILVHLSRFHCCRVKVSAAAARTSLSSALSPPLILLLSEAP